MTFIPNEADAYDPRQSDVDQYDWSQLSSINGVVSGCAVSERAAGANQSVDVSAGYVHMAGSVIEVAATNVALSAAPTGTDEARFDLITVNGSGTLTARAGTASTTYPVFSIVTGKHQQTD